MSNTASLKKEYAERIAPALKSQFQYSSTMQIPVLKKIVINQGLGMAVADKKIIEVAINEMTAITGQKAVATISRKDIANFKLRKKMPIGVMVTLRRERMYEFLEKLVRVALTTQSYHNANRHFLTQLKVCNILTRNGCHGFLASDSSHFINCHFNNLLVGNSHTQTLIDNNLLKYGYLHCRRILEL
jgi:hypothetical protein